MRNKRITIVLLLLIIPIALTILVSQMKLNTQKSIDAIYVGSFTDVSGHPAYKIDLKEEELWVYPWFDQDSYIVKDPASLKGGATMYKLDSKKIQQFLLASKKARFTHWRASYDNQSIMDGHFWGITIVFSDSSEKQINGYSKYPRTWNQMYDAFEELTGQNILLVKPD